MKDQYIIDIYDISERSFESIYGTKGQSFCQKCLVGNITRSLTVFVLEPDLDEAVIAAGGGKQCSVRAEGHVQHGGGWDTAPHTLPAPLLLLTPSCGRGGAHRILTNLKRYTTPT